MPISAIVPAYVFIIAVAMAGLVEEPPYLFHVVPEAPEESAPITLEGNLTRERYYGPPNYGETPERDRTKHATILDLRTPLCTPVRAGKGCAVPHIHNSVQLVVPREQREAVPKEGCIVVTGPLFRAHTGHHRRPILMQAHMLEPCEH